MKLKRKQPWHLLKQAMSRIQRQRIGNKSTNVLLRGLKEYKFKPEEGIITSMKRNKPLK